MNLFKKLSQYDQAIIEILKEENINQEWFTKTKPKHNSKKINEILFRANKYLY